MEKNEPTTVRIRIRPAKNKPGGACVVPRADVPGALNWNTVGADGSQQAADFQYDKVYGAYRCRKETLAATGAALIQATESHTVPDVSAQFPTQNALVAYAGQDSTQTEVFADCVHVVDMVLSGCNGCILAYGQTGAGKTHTLFGAVRDPELQGVVPRAIARLGQGIAGACSERQGTVFRVTVSIVEIYCERIRCLLAEGGSGKDNLAIKTDPLRGTYVEGATEVEVCDEAELKALMGQGLAVRSVAGATMAYGSTSSRIKATAMNSESSRSHCVVTIRVEQSLASGEARLGKLVLGDLAGSERASKTGAQGALLAEGALINKGLSCLANVIYALTETPAAGGAPRHVPYRDSKLTRLLQDSLGGTARTVLLCCCSPDQDNAAETMSTLRFGSRAKGLTCKLQVNQRLSAERLQQLLTAERTAKEQLQSEVARLQAALTAAGCGSLPPLPDPTPVDPASTSDSEGSRSTGRSAANNTHTDPSASNPTQGPTKSSAVTTSSAPAKVHCASRTQVVVDWVFWGIMVLCVLVCMWWEDQRRLQAAVHTAACPVK